MHISDQFLDNVPKHQFNYQLCKYFSNCQCKKAIYALLAEVTPVYLSGSISKFI